MGVPFRTPIFRYSFFTFLTQVNENPEVAPYICITKNLKTKEYESSDQ
jgi:hypothetical protein